MGWLHDGHRSLMRRARADDATTVVTIFVNPRQFGDAGRLHALPAQRGARPRHLRAEERRPRLGAAGRRGLPARLRHDGRGRRHRPAPRGRRATRATSTASRRWSRSSSRWSGAEHAYFGQKDAQQVMVIRRMARDLALPTQVDRLLRRSASRTAWRSRRATCTSPRRSERRRRCSTARWSRVARLWEAGERSGDALRAEMRAVLGDRAAGRRRLRVVSRTAGRSRSSTASTARRCCRWRSGSGRPGSSTTSRWSATWRSRRRRSDRVGQPCLASRSSPSSTAPWTGAASSTLTRACGAMAVTPRRIRSTIAAGA